MQVTAKEHAGVNKPMLNLALRTTSLSTCQPQRGVLQALPASISGARVLNTARSCRCRTATLEELQTETQCYVWQGHDEYDALEDRRDAAPLPLPPLQAPRRIVLVRHGQSTWNAEGRVQGSCNLSVLTEKGKAQAHTTRELVRTFPVSTAFPCLCRLVLCLSRSSKALH